MNTDHQKLRDQVQSLQFQLTDAKEQLDQLVRTCTHEWGQPERRVENKPGYYIPGDREQGIELGVDSRPGMHVPGSCIVWWERECEKCGLVQKTNVTRPIAVEPVFE